MFGIVGRFVEAEAAAKFHAAVDEFGLFALAIALVVGALAVAFYVPRVFPFRGKIIAALLIAAAFACAWNGGFRQRGRLDASANYLREIEQKNAELAERQREADAANELARRASARAADLDQKVTDNADLAQTYLDELNAAHDACALSDADLRRLRGFRRNDPGIVPPVPAKRPAGLGAAGSVSVLPRR